MFEMFLRSACWPSRQAIAALLVCSGLACSSQNDESDGGLLWRDAADAREGGVHADALVGDPSDALAGDAELLDATRRDFGVYDAGRCGCSYGFQQQCEESEFCGGGFVDEPQCSRADPFGWFEEGACSIDLELPSIAGAGCNATCVPIERGSPCSEIENRDFVSAMIYDWWSAIAAPATRSDAPEYVHMDKELLDKAYDDWIRFRRCNFFVQRTVFAAAELCREGFVVPESGALHVDLRWRFQRIDRDDPCQASVGLCIDALALGVRAPENATDLLDELPSVCGGRNVSYGAPCTGADGHRCLKARLATMIRALNAQ